MLQHLSQAVIFLLIVMVTGEDLHDFLGLNVPFFNKDSGKAVYVLCYSCVSPVIYEPYPRP